MLPARNIENCQLENLSRFEGAGVYYGATHLEAQLCGGEEVIVVGGGNSAGQAAVFLAQTARRVYMLVRADGLADKMSRYLIRRIEESPTIDLRTNSEVISLEGNDYLERVQWRDNKTGSVETHNVSALFSMTGAVPNSSWLEGCVACDARGIHQDRIGSVRGRFGSCTLAAYKRASFARNKSARSLRGRRCSGRQRKARGVSRG